MPDTLDLPIGFESFHRKRFLNYQLNRAHSLGYARRDELRDVAGRISDAADGVRELDALSARAEAEGRMRHAASYQRVAEFFTRARSPEKLVRYRRYRDLFDAGFAATGVHRHDVPFGESALPAYVLPAVGPSRGTVLLHGGFDSLIEEFFAIWDRIAAAGFQVVAFEGPGQGGARRLGGVGGHLDGWLLGVAGSGSRTADRPGRVLAPGP